MISRLFRTVAREDGDIAMVALLRDFTGYRGLTHPFVVPRLDRGIQYSGVGRAPTLAY